MKKILIVALMLLLVGCSKGVDLSYEKGSTIGVWWQDGTSFNISDETVVKSVFDLIDNSKLEEISLDDSVGYLYFIQLNDQTSIRSTDKLIIGISGKDYTFKTSIKNELESLLALYLPADDTIVVELENNLNDSKKDDAIADIDLSAYTTAGMLSDGSEVFYLSDGTYYKLELASKIIKVLEGKSYVIDEGALSVPKISPSGEILSFVNGVGFEENGLIKLYANNELTDVSSTELTEKEEQSRTIKSCDWYSDTQLICLLGYDTGTTSQGGDVYIINTETGKTKMLIDSKEGKEIAYVSYDEPIMTYEVVTWLDESYQYYSYESKEVEITSLTSGFPIKEEWIPKKLDLNHVTAKEILSLDLFDESLIESDMSHLTLDKGGYIDGSIKYIFSMYAETIWRIDILGETTYKLPRGVAVGQTLDEVLNKLPHEKNYIKEDGLIYGERSIDFESQSEMAEITRVGSNHELVITTATYTPSIKIVFEQGIVKKIEVYFYESN